MDHKVNRYLVDFHIHSTFSDGQLSIAEIVDLYGQKGFAAIAITDHLTDTKTLTGNVSRKLNLSLNQNNFTKYLETIHSESVRALAKYNMLVIPGVEVTLNSWSRAEGAHIVLLNVNEVIDADLTIKDLLSRYKSTFRIAAHPLWEKAFEFKTTLLWDRRQELATYFDAWECGTGTHFSPEVHQSGYAVIASSDFHNRHYTPSWKTVVYADELKMSSLFKSIRQKRCEALWI